MWAFNTTFLQTLSHSDHTAQQALRKSGGKGEVEWVLKYLSRKYCYSRFNTEYYSKKSYSKIIHLRVCKYFQVLHMLQNAHKPKRIWRVFPSSQVLQLLNFPPLEKRHYNILCPTWSCQVSTLWSPVPSSWPRLWMLHRNSPPDLKQKIRH